MNQELEIERHLNLLFLEREVWKAASDMALIAANRYNLALGYRSYGLHS
jgi:hypothetical protein